MVTPDSRLLRTVLVLVVALCAAGGCSDTAPGPASAPTLLVAQVGGIWGGQLTLTDSVARFESASSQAGQQCLQQQLVAAFGATTEATMVIDQTSSALSARMTADRVGLACQYSGTANLSTLTMTASSCNATGLVVECPSGVREMRLVGSSIVADVRGGIISGSASSTYNIIGVGTGGGPLGSMAVSQSLRAVRR